MSNHESAITRASGLPLRAYGKRLLKVLLVSAVMFVPLWWVQGKYMLVYDGIKGANCLPYSVYVVDLRDKDVRRGDYVAFTANQMEPFYRKGTPAVKLLAGIPGDRVIVDERGIQINGKPYGELVHVKPGEKLHMMGHTLSQYLRDVKIPADHFAMMGTYERSFDSRYWGFVRNDQVVGRAIPLW